MSDSNLNLPLVQELKDQNNVQQPRNAFESSKTTCPNSQVPQDYNFLFTQLSPLIAQVYSKQKRLENEDTFAYTTENTNVELIICQLKLFWSKKPNATLFQTCYHMTSRAFLIAQLYAIFYTAFLNQVTNTLSAYDDTSAQAYTIIAYLLAMMILNLTKTAFQIKYNWWHIVWESRLKATLQYTVFCKALRSKQYHSSTSSSQEQDEDSGQDENALPDVNNLMTVDVDELMEFCWACESLLSNSLQIAIILYMLYVFIDKAILNTVYVILAASVVNFVLSLMLQHSYEVMMPVKDRRVALTNDVVEGMKSIKYLSWENVFEQKVLAIRKKEFKKLAVVRGVDALLTVFWISISHVMMYVFVIGYFSEESQKDLREINIFVVIALFESLTLPIGLLPWSINSIYKSRISFRRIKKYMLQPEIDSSLNSGFSLSEAQVVNSQTTTHQLMTNININQSNLSEVSILQQSSIVAPQGESIAIDCMAFRWPELEVPKQQNLLLEINQNTKFCLNIKKLRIQAGEATFVVGKIGSGKTALLNAIMNEMDASQLQQDCEEDINQQFRFSVRGSLAHVAQNHWLQNISIRDNILFGKEFESRWYAICVEACQLKADFSQFQNGDSKLVGPQGNNLSGGQKQRISLCRALYQDSDIYLLDDIFSSLDAQVADAVFAEVVCRLLVARRKTVLLVTSHYKYVHQQCDNLEGSKRILLIESGKIVEEPKIIEDYLRQELEKEVQQQNAKNTEFESTVLVQDLSGHTSLLLSEKQHHSNMNQEVEEEGEEEAEANEEYRDEGNLQSETYLIYLRAMGCLLFVNYILWNLALVFMNSLIDFWLRDQADQEGKTFSWLNSCFGGNAAAVFTLLIVIEVSCSGVRCIFYMTCTLIAASRMFKKLNSTIFYSNMKFFDSNPKGRIMNRISNDIFVVDDQLPDNQSMLLTSAGECLIYPIGISIVMPYLILVILLCFVLIMFVTRYFRACNREVKRLSSINEGKLLSLLDEMCKGTVTLRVFAKQEWILKEYVHRADNALRTYVLSNAGNLWMEGRLLLIGDLLFASVALFCIIVLAFGLSFEYQQLSFALTYAILIPQSFYYFVIDLCANEKNFISIERLRQYDLYNGLENLESEPGEKKLLQEVSSNEMPAISFRNVWLSYEKTVSQCYALKGFNLNIRKGEKIAFCGRTGSGKTSILNVLFRLYEFQDGEIYVNGIETRSMSLRALRQQMSIIPQFGFLYNATLKDNIDPLELFSEEEVNKKIDDTGLRIREGSMAEDGLCDFEVEDSGANLSNGEKQIINFLRIVLRDQSIVCLDEATSNMDPKTDCQLHEKLFEFCQNKTLLVVTHRLENIDKFDRVVVLENGKVAEIGHVSELRKIDNGFFNRLLKNKEQYLNA